MKVCESKIKINKSCKIRHLDRSKCTTIFLLYKIYCECGKKKTNLEKQKKEKKTQHCRLTHLFFYSKFGPNFFTMNVNIS